MNENKESENIKDKSKRKRISKKYKVEHRIKAVFFGG